MLSQGSLAIPFSRSFRSQFLFLMLQSALLPFQRHARIEIICSRSAVATYSRRVVDKAVGKDKQVKQHWLQRALQKEALASTESKTRSESTSVSNIAGANFRRITLMKQEDQSGMRIALDFRSQANMLCRTLGKASQHICL